MIKLVPDWAQDYQAFWTSIRNRNLWLIHMRYGAILMLVLLYLASNLLDVALSETQLAVLIIITISILLYNLLLHKLRQYLTCELGKFNPLHFSLLQMFLDLIALMLLVYYSGTIETPLYMLFIFHMIIGSLILPGYLILFISLAVMGIFTAIVGFEYYDIIPHHHLYGIHDVELKRNFNFIISSLGIFNFTVFTAVLITSRIAKRLYKREQELKETLQELNNAEEAKQKYIMAVVHEIKSPIVAAQSIVELIKNGYVGSISDKIEEKLGRTIVRTDEALTLINNILRISKLKLLGEVTFEKVDVLELINLVSDQKSDLIQSKNIVYEINDLRTDKNEIDSDPMLIELVLSNIIGNAIKYTLENEKILLELKNENDLLIINISDSGIGIPQNEIEKIFQQFYRATNLPSKKYEGSGLGLSLVQEIVERLNGGVEIKSPSKIGSKNNPGTTVTVKLPISKNS